MTGMARVHELLAGSLSSFPWPVVIGDWRGQSYRLGGNAHHWCGKPLGIRFNNDRSIKDLLSLNGLGVLEGFVRGDVDITGNLYALPFLKHYLDLKLSPGRLLVALFKNRYAQTIERAKVSVQSHYDIPQQVLEIYLDRAYMSYSCGMFEEPSHFDIREMSQPGNGEQDTFDSLEKAQWRKFRDAVEFIDPGRRETLLDVGCGYAGQLIVALESSPVGKVVGCTHSHNQAMKGRERLSRFDTSKWELREADYRTDTRVFDHVTSTGMISHVGPRGLVPYVRSVRQRIKPGGRYVHHALMTAYTGRPLEASPGVAFNKKYVWPGFHWFTFGDHVRALEQNGFQILRAVNLSAHYSKTAAAWYERLVRNEAEVLRLVNRQTYRAWQLYLAGCSGAFQSKDSHVYRLYCEAVGNRRPLDADDESSFKGIETQVTRAMKAGIASSGPLAHLSS